MPILPNGEGRAVVIAVNKWDQVRDKGAVKRDLQEKLDRLLPQLRGVALVTVSALKERGLSELKQSVTEAYRVWNTRVPTGRLNGWLTEMVAHHPPPAPSGTAHQVALYDSGQDAPPDICRHVLDPRRRACGV